MSKKWIIILMTLFLTVQTALVFAEDDEFSPWEAWRQGFSNYEKGEQSKNRGNAEEALKCFQRAREYYVAVQNNRPEWNQKIIGSRIKMCDQEISELKGEISKHRNESAAPEERISPKTATKPSSYSSSAASSEGIPSTVSTSSFGKDVDSDTSEVKAELDKYKKKLFAVLVEVDELRRQAERGQSASREVENMIKEKGVLQQQLSLLQQKYDALNEKITQPDTEKNELKNRMLEEKMKMEILTQKLKMQDDNYEKLRHEMADLFKDKTEAKFAQQQSEQKIRELNDQILRYEKESSDRGSQIRGLNAQIAQLTQNNNVNLAGIKEKQEEISKLNKWIEELRAKDGSQNKMSGEVMNENKAIREKFDALKEQNEKLAQENQELKNKQLEENISFTRMKDTVKLINDQKNSIVDEYNGLTKKYNQSILEEGANTKEIQNLREQNSKQDRELKLFVDKYEKIQKRLEERSANEYQSILAVNKTNSELTEKLNSKSDELNSLNLKYEQLNKANQDSANALADLKAKMYAMNAENSSLREESKNLVAIKSEVQTLQQDSQILRKEKAEMAGQRDKYQTALDSTTKEIASLKKELEALQGVSGELLEARKQIQSLKNELAGLKDADKMNAQIREELKAMTAVKDENQQLNEQLTKSRNAIAELKDKCQKLTESGDKIQQSANALEAEKKSLNLQLAEKDKMVDSLKEENKKTLANQQQIQDSLRDASKNDKDKIASLDEINKRLTERMNAQTREDQKAVAAVKDENQQLNEQLTKSRNAITELETKCRTLADAGDKIQQSVNALDAEKKNFNLQLAEKDKMVDSLKEENKKSLAGQQQVQDSLREASKNDKNKIASLDEINKRLADALEKSINDNRIMEQSVNNLKSENAGLLDKQKRFEQSNLEIKQIQEKVDKLVAEKSSLQNEIKVMADLKNENAEMKLKIKEMADLKENYKALNSNYQEALEQIKRISNNSSDEMNKKLGAMLDKSKSEKQELSEKVIAMQSEISAIPALKKQLADQGQALKEYKEKYQAATESSSKINMELSQLDDLKKTNVALTAKNREMVALQDDYKKLQSSYQQALQSINSYQQSNKDKLASLDELNKKLGAMLDKSKIEKKELSEKVIAMQSEISVIPALKKQLADQEQAVVEYKTKYQAATESNSKINMDMSKLDELKKANAALTAKNREMIALQDDYKKLQLSYQQALQNINSYQQSDKNKLASLDELNKKLAHMLDKSKNENQKLSQEMDALKQNNSTISALKEEINVLKNSRTGDAEARKTLATQLARVDSLKEQLSSMDSSLAVMKRQLAERDAVVLDLRTRLSGKSVDADLGAKYAAAENKINALAANLRESIEKIKSLESQLAEKKSGAPEVKLAAPAVPAVKIQELLTNGIVAEKKQDFEVALWHFQMVLESEPGNLIAHRHLGKLYLQIEDYDKAVEHLSRAVKADSKNSDTVADYGFALLGAKRYDEAAETFKNLIKNQSDNPKARFGLGCALQSKGDVKNAEKEFRAALRIKPDSVEIMQKLALLLAGDKDKTGEASELYRKSRKLGGSPEPELEKLLSGKLASANNEAVSFLQQAAADAEKSKDWGSAAWYYSQLVDLSPDNAEILNKLGMLYLLQNSPDKTLKALKINDNDISGLLTSADAWIFKGNSAKALEMFAKAQTALGKNPQYSRPELLKSLDSTVELKIKNLPDDADKKAEKVYDLFKQFSKK